MKDILEVMIKNLVEEPNAVSVEEVSNEKETILKVKVSEKDMGRVIGKQGRMAKSIRTVMKAIAVKKNEKISIEFVD